LDLEGKDAGALSGIRQTRARGRACSGRPNVISPVRSKTSEYGAAPSGGSKACWTAADGGSGMALGMATRCTGTYWAWSDLPVDILHPLVRAPAETRSRCICPWRAGERRKEDDAREWRIWGGRARKDGRAYVVGGLTEYLSTMRRCWAGRKEVRADVEGQLGRGRTETLRSPPRGTRRAARHLAAWLTPPGDDERSSLDDGGHGELTEDEGGGLVSHGGRDARRQEVGADKTLIHSCRLSQGHIDGNLVISFNQSIYATSTSPTFTDFPSSPARRKYSYILEKSFINSSSCRVTASVYNFSAALPRGSELPVSAAACVASPRSCNKGRYSLRQQMFSFARDLRVPSSLNPSRILPHSPARMAAPGPAAPPAPGC